jgi:putative membrane protein
VLSAFAIGLAVGVLGMVPRWWKQRNAATRLGQTDVGAPETTPQPNSIPTVPHGL